MQLWQYIVLIALALGGLALLIAGKLKKRRLRLERDFTRRLETVLKPKETVETVCPARGGRWVLTNQRLLLETGDGFTAIPFCAIRSVKGVTAEGKATAAPAKMASMTVRAGETYTLRSTGEAFCALAKGLKAQVSRNKKKS